MTDKKPIDPMDPEFSLEAEWEAKDKKPMSDVDKKFGGVRRDHNWLYELGKWPICSRCGYSIPAGMIKESKQKCFKNKELKYFRETVLKLHSVMDKMRSVLR